MATNLVTPPEPAGDDKRPWIMLDLDGVIAQPILNYNIAISRQLAIPPLPAEVRQADSPERRSIPRTLHRLSHELRYFGRRPLPLAEEGLAALVQYRRPIIVTGRSWLVEGSIRRWLDQHGFSRYVEDVIPNNTNLRTAQFKLRIAQIRQIEEQVDDDGSIVYYLAKHGLRRVYLRDWPRNRGLPYPENVTVVRNLVDVAEDVGRRGGA